MAIVAPTTGNPLFTRTTTAQNVMDAVARDVRQTLSSTASPDSTVLLDYTNRISLEMLGTSRWMFTLANPQVFVTQGGITDYWVGPIGQAPTGVYDTQLNLTDLRIIKPKSVKDRSNFRPLGQVDESPITAKLAFPDKVARTGRPSVWRQNPSTPEILNIYPAPDNQNNFSPMPSTPICGIVSGGSLPGRIYFVTVTYVDSLGNESTAPWAAQVFVPANMLLEVFPPIEPEIAGASGIKYDRYNVYAASVGTTENSILYFNSLPQQTTLVSTNYPWFEPTSGLVTTGPFPPSSNGVMPIWGYVIEFRYFQQRVQLTDPSQVLQIPDDYKQYLIDGVAARTFQYLARPQEAMVRYQMYRDGLSQIVRDLNFISKSGEYIHPDASSIGQFLPTIETLDSALLIP